MIWLFSCACGGSESLLRKKLRRWGYQHWDTAPLYQGKEKAIQQLASANDIPEVDALLSFIRNSSKYAVVLGSKDGQVAWSDVSHNDFPSDARAENIVKALS